MSTRRRERRISAGASRSSRADPAIRSPETATGGAASARSRLPTCLFFLFFPFLLYFAMNRRPRHDTAAEGGPMLPDHARALVKREITYREVLSVSRKMCSFPYLELLISQWNVSISFRFISTLFYAIFCFSLVFLQGIQEHSKVSGDTSIRHFPNPVLAYVTPWNSVGYEMAERFGSKLTHVSPVWYELKSEEKKFVLEGRHNADSGWISRIRANGKSLMLPRVVLEAFPSEMLKMKKQREVIQIIVTECREMGYDGIVLESWSRWAMHGVLHDMDMRKKALDFIKELAMALHSLDSLTSPSGHLELVYVIPAPRSQDLREHDFGPDDLQELSDVVDGFSLMTYDFSGLHSPGPNAPLLWVRSCLQLLLGDNDLGKWSNANKIFLGINFYGNDFVLAEGLDGGAITGRDYLSLLQKHKPELRWENRSAEHLFIYSHNNIRHAVFYPSLTSISMRLDEARAWGAGLSIWEIGQGLVYFFDLL